MHGAVG